jgi:exopolyphosphatase/guanosine-5'-triphosphate,3'-diphosphate pyrophosphatase
MNVLKAPSLAPPVLPVGSAALAALDLGTNNCRLLIAQPVREGFRVLDTYSRMVRLGEGLDRSGELQPAAQERALAALRVCAQRLARRPVARLRAVATEACRRARNGPAFLARVAEETGLEIEIISAREEVELALESCTPLLGGAARRVLLFDIGGGSTEIAWIRLDGPQARPVMVGYFSLPLGVVTLAERLGAEAATPAGFFRAVEEVTAALEPFERVHCIAKEIRCGGVELLGTSGTMTTLAGVVLDLPRYRRPLIDGVVLEAARCRTALEALLGASRERLARHPCIGADRADYILPGCAIFAAIHRLWPASRLVIADRGLREGIILRMMQRGRGRPRRGAARGAAPWAGLGAGL